MSQVIYGYVNAAPDADPPTSLDSFQRTNLVSAITNASVTMTEGNATLQVPTWVKPEGGDSYLFTTLYPAVASGEGTTTFSLTDEWKSSRAIGSLAADAPYPLWQVLDVLGSDYLVIGVGVQEDPGETSIVKSISWLDTTHTFDNPTPTVETVTNNEVSSKSTPYAGWHQGYAEGSTAVDRQQVNSTGLVLNPVPSQVLRGETNNTNEFDGHQYELGDVLADGAAVNVKAGAVTFQIALFFKDNTGAPQFTTLRSESFGVGTHQLDPSAAWTTSSSIRSANAVTFPASSQHSISEYVDAFRDYKVIGFGVQASATATVTDLTWAGRKYHFIDKAPVAGSLSAKTTAGKAVTITLKASDPEGASTSISINKAPGHGKVSVNQSTEKATYTPTSGFAGSDSFKYTVKDASGYTTVGTVSLSVAKVKSSVTTSVTNKPITTKKQAKVAVTVKASGAKLVNGKVTAKSGGKQIGSGKLNSNGKVTLKLKKLKKGEKKVKISFAGVASATSSSKTITIKVKTP